MAAPAMSAEAVPRPDVGAGVQPVSQSDMLQQYQMYVNQ